MGASLEVAIEEHLHRVFQEAPSELEAAQIAAQLTLATSKALGLGPFVEAVLVDSKPRLILRFRAGQRHQWPEATVVLKVYGDGPRGEGPLQDLWHSRGVPTVPTLHGRSGPGSWVLMPELDLHTLRPRQLDEWLALTNSLAWHASRMHEQAPALVDVLRPLAAVMGPRLRHCVGSLERAGHTAPKGWEQRSAEAYGEGDSPLHGDLALSNIGVNPKGQLTLYDASALLGPPSFDAVRWAARAASSRVRPEDLLACWATHEPLPLTDLLDSLLATECLLEAGSRCIIAERNGSIPDVSRLLATAARM